MFFKKGHKSVGTAVAVMLGISMLLTKCGLPTWAVELNKAMSLTVQPGGKELLEDLANANIVYDLYYIAEAEKLEGYEDITFQVLSPYGKEGATDSEYVEVKSGMDNDDWKQQAQNAARIAHRQDIPVISGIAANEVITKDDSGKALQAGVYLLMARGSDVKNYAKEITDEAGNLTYVTIANSDTYVYRYAPELVVLPGRAAEDNGEGTMLNTGEWLYDQTIVLKPDQALRFGSLEIVKRLASYETKDPATFVFEVNAVQDEEVVYSDVVSLSFTSPGEKKVLLEKIPVGANVTVKEVYSGAVYQATTEKEYTAVIEADKLSTIAFTNAYNGTGKGGGAVINRFEYTSESGWKWSQISDKE